MSKYVKMIGKKASKAIENKVDSTTKNKVLKKFLVLLKKNEKKILQQNKKDIKFAKTKYTSIKKARLVPAFLL